MPGYDTFFSLINNSGGTNCAVPTNDPARLFFYMYKNVPFDVKNQRSKPVSVQVCPFTPMHRE